MNEKKYREFTVTPGISGFKVKIGCTEAYFGDARSLREAIGEYLDDPVGAAAAYSKGDLRYGIESARPPAPSELKQPADLLHGRAAETAVRQRNRLDEEAPRGEGGKG